MGDEAKVSIKYKNIKKDSKKMTFLTNPINFDTFAKNNLWKSKIPSKKC